MQTCFFRLLKTPIDDKGDALGAQIAALNETREAEETYTLDPADFALIPRSSFAYWVSDDVRRFFQVLPRFEPDFGEARTGLQSLGADEIFIRAWWEISPRQTGRSGRWVDFAKGGESTVWFGDVHLVTDWENDGERQKTFAIEKYNSVTRKITGMAHYFRPGLTYTTYTNKGLHVRALPADCIFSLAGPGVFANDWEDVWWIFGLLNSSLLEFCLRLMTDRRKWEPGYVKSLPLNHPSSKTAKRIQELVQESCAASRNLDCSDETTHAFCLPGLAQHRGAESLLQASLALEAEAQAAQARLSQIQAEIDEITFDLYGLSETDRALVRAEMGEPETSNLELETAEEDDEDEITPPEDLPSRVQNLLMWCVGVAFGRWDVRMAQDPTLLPPLQGPFDPLPRCAPGALIGQDSLPPAKAADIAPEAWLRARQNVLDIPSLPLPHPHTSYPFPIAWDSILVDDPTHPSDIVARVRGVLSLLWGDRAGAIEREACEILGVKGLRDYFRDSRKGFFAFHVKRYSKSRRKAPIYWLLQSEKRNYGIWLYIHRLRPDALFVAGRDYADAKVALEEARLEELRQGLDGLPPTDGGDERGGLSGSARRHREREIERQQRLVAEVTEFRDRLDRVALSKLPPDLNDGVTISIAPLWELAPWKEAQRTWDKLVAGEYAWSTMAQRMRERGLVQPEG